MKLEILNAESLALHQEQLSEFERAFTYPLGEQRFSIDHGSRYSAFFEDLGEPLFALLSDDNAVIGILAAMQKTIRYGQLEIPAVYYGDLKIHPDFQRRGLTRKLIAAFFKHWFLRPHRWLLVHYGISMQKNGSDTFGLYRNHNLAGRFKALSQQTVFFEAPEKLANLAIADIDESKVMKRPLNLSPAQSSSLISLRHKKDLIIESKPLNFAHFGEVALTGSQYLKALQKAGTEGKGRFDQICFALDDRRSNLLAHLKHQGIESNAKATVSALPSPFLIRKPTCAFVCTSEI